MVHSLVNGNTIHTLSQSTYTSKIDSWALAHCLGHFLNTTTSMMRYRAGASHRTLIYKRPSRSMLLSSLCISPQQLFNFKGGGNSQGLCGKVRRGGGGGCPGSRIKKKLLGSLETNLNLVKNLINSRISLTNQLASSFWTEMKERRGGMWGWTGGCVCIWTSSLSPE